jgi:hypothetical protein
MKPLNHPSTSRPTDLLDRSPAEVRHDRFVRLIRLNYGRSPGQAKNTEARAARKSLCCNQRFGELASLPADAIASISARLARVKNASLLGT